MMFCGICTGQIDPGSCRLYGAHPATRARSHIFRNLSALPGRPRSCRNPSVLKDLLIDHKDLDNAEFWYVLKDPDQAGIYLPCLVDLDHELWESMVCPMYHSSHVSGFLPLFPRRCLWALLKQLLLLCRVHLCAIEV